MTVRRQIHFYAMRDDMIKVLSDFEALGPVKYVLTGMFETPEVQSYLACLDIPTLGTARFPNAVAGWSYLITSRDSDVHAARVPQNLGGVKYAVSQRSAWDSVVLRHGGTYNNQTLLYGTVSTISDSEWSVRAYSVLMKLIKKHFSRTATYWVGESAEAFGRAGGRLTIGNDSPGEYDLELPAHKH